MPAVLRRVPGDWHVLEIRGERDVPDYDPKVIGRGMPESKFRRECLGDWTATEGKLVYPEFGDIHISREPLPFDPSQPLIGGWDFGGSAWTGTPAFVPCQLNSYGQLMVYPSLCPPEQETVGIYAFSWEVADHLTEEFALPYGKPLDALQLIHYGDPAGNNRPSTGITVSRGVEVQSCYEIIREGMRVVKGHDPDTGEELATVKPGVGWDIDKGEVSLAKRMETLRNRLETIVHGAPALIVDPDATDIIDAFRGGHHYHQRLDGRYELDPYKGWHSHIVNALEYACSRLAFAVPVRPDEHLMNSYEEYAGTATSVGLRRSKRRML